LKSVIKGLSSVRLEQEIAAKYWQRYEDWTTHYNRTGQMLANRGLMETGILALLWEEFDARMAAGTIDPETDWSEDDDDL
jgi:hypothetical protein